MKKEYIIFGIVAILAIIFLKPNMELQSIIGDPSVSHSINFDIDAPVQEQMKFGSDIFSINPTSYNFDECGIEEYNAPEPDSSCWTTTVTFQDNSFNFSYGESKEINDFFIATFRTTASVEEPDEDNDDYWIEQGSNLFTFQIYNDDFIEPKIVPQNSLVVLNEPTTLKVQIRNDLANNLEGGLVITTIHYLENQVPTITREEMIFKKGISTYNIDIDTSKLGRMKVQIRAFATIMGTEFHDDRVDELTFNIVPFIDEGAFSVDCSESECGKGFRCENIIYNSQEYNICIKSVKGELSDFNEWSIENVDIRLVFALLLALALLVYLSNRGK